MLRRYPYWGWLFLSVLLWCGNGYHFHLHRQAMLPVHMARAVNADLKHREEVFEHFINDKDLLRKLFADSLSEKENTQICNSPFYIFCYRNDSLILWNTNTVIAAPNDTIKEKWGLLHNEKGIFLSRSVQPPLPGSNKRVVVLLPVLITYPVENEYLRSHFPASDYIPAKTKIIPASSGYITGTYPVKLRDEQPLFYLYFDAHDIQKWTPDKLFLTLLIASILASLSWIQLMIIYISRKRSPLWGLFITVGVIVLLRVWLVVFGLPFNLDTLSFFSPLLYASNKYLPSFGDLFINALCFLWLAIFITRHTPYQTYFSKVKSGWAKNAIACLLLPALFAYIMLIIKLVRSLVLDSKISFDVSHFYSINTFTILGLTVIGAISGLSCLVIYLFNYQLTSLINNNRIKYLLLVFTGTVFIFASGNYNGFFYWAILGWVLLFFAGLDIKKYTLVADLFEPRMIFWAIFICLFSTFMVQYYNQLKERTSRIAYVEDHLSPHQDIEIEYAFDKKAKTIERDDKLQNFFYNPSLAARKAVNQFFETQYLTGAFDKYQAKIYLFDADKRPLYNSDTADYYSLLNEKNESASTSSSYLFYKESILDRHFYLSYMPVYSDTINKVIGYIFIDLDLKKQVTETVYPELLQPVTNQENAEENEYAYAIYINDKLVTQTKDYPFTTTLNDDTLKALHYAFYTKSNISELYYKVSDKRTVVIVHYHSEILEVIVLFSYIFGIQVLLALLVLLYQLYLSYIAQKSTDAPRIRFSLRRRVHLSMLAIVLLSFVIIGGVTIIFFSREYRDANANKLQTVMQVAKQSVQDYLKQRNGYDADYIFDSVSRTPNFKYFITALATNQKTDINIYDDNGILFSTSQDDIFEKALISRMMRPEAFYQLNVSGKSIVIQEERVAGLSYLSAYEPLRDEHGITLGYLNVPFFSSEKDRDFQISNIVVTLINVYAIIFLLSSVISLFITRWITATFKIITQQFEHLNLQKNDRVSWPYDDEVGLLVREYNKMASKVEANAILLAQSERETAWREMAQQVAHEIKNPLTPMKLNIQYLQQAMKNDNPNIKELTDKVSDSIIEQINNLSYIASEFSNFARMPDAKAEEIDLKDLLHKALELYQNNEHVAISVNFSGALVTVLADRSQLLRVFTNLLENAKQAIPEGRQGAIKVVLHTEAGHALISISDNGVGIADDAVKKIFQPYFTTKSSGTGLGLAMTRKIIEFWKGTIWFETVDGVGTTFYIKLPVVKGEG